MRLRQFLDAGYVLLVDEYQRLGSDLTGALEKLSEWSSGGKRELTPEQAQLSEEVAQAQANAKAMSELNRMLMGVS